MRHLNINSNFTQKYKELLFICLIFIFFTIIFTFPSIIHLSDKIIGDGVDSSAFFGMQNIIKVQMDAGNYPFGWTNYWRYPAGINLTQSIGSVIFLGIGFIYYLFLNDPVLVFNISILSIVFLNGLLSYLYFKKISSNFLLGILGGLAYGYSFYLLARLGGHVHTLFIGCFPFFAYSLINFYEKKGDIKSYVILTISIILLFATSLQHLLVVIASAIFIIPIILILYKNVLLDFLKIIFKNKVKTIFLLTTTSFIFIFIFHNILIPYFSGLITSYPIGYTRSVSPIFADFFVPGYYTPLWIGKFFDYSFDTGGIEGAVFIGFIEIILFLLFNFSKINQKIKFTLLLSVLAIFILNIGCHANYYPYCSLYSFMPFRSIAEVSRYYPILYLFVISGIILYLKRIEKKYMILSLILIGLIVERLPFGFYLTDIPKDNFISLVQRIDSSAVLDLPTLTEWNDVKQRSYYDLYSVYYKKPIVNGYMQWLGSTQESESFLNKLSLITCDTKQPIDEWSIRSISQLLLENNIKAFVYHKNLEISDPNPNMCDQAISNISIFVNSSPLNLSKVYEDDQVIVYEY